MWNGKRTLRRANTHGYSSTQILTFIIGVASILLGVYLLLIVVGTLGVPSFLEGVMEPAGAVQLSDTRRKAFAIPGFLVFAGVMLIRQSLRP